MLTNATYKIYFSLPEKWNTYEDYSGLNVEWCYETGKPEHVRVTGDLDSITKGPFFVAAEGNREFRIDRGQDTFAPTQFIKWDGRHIFNLYQSWAGDFFIRHIASINGLILYGRYNDSIMGTKAIVAGFMGGIVCVDHGTLLDMVLNKWPVYDGQAINQIALFLLAYQNGRTMKWRD